MKDFAVVVPTVRDRRVIAPRIADLYASFSLSTDLYVLDGGDGKCQALNRLMINMPSDYWFLATIDDDIKLPQGWQEAVDNAFHDIPGLGAVGIWLGDSEEAASYMVNCPAEPKVYGDTKFRELMSGNIGGICFIMRLSVAFSLETYPTGEEKYTFAEDGYRCSQLRKLGYRFGYIDCPSGPATILSSPDSPEYLEMKRRDIEYVKQHMPPL